MKSSQDSKQQTTRFGSNPKKITCQCTAEELIGEFVTIQMNSRCPVCHTLFQISIPKSAMKALQPRKETAYAVNVDHWLLPVEVNAQLVYRASDWMTGVLAL